MKLEFKLQYIARIILHRVNQFNFGSNLTFWRQRKNLYKRIHEFDENLPDDIEDVLEVSATLEIREYDVFGLAYSWWYGRNAQFDILEAHFARYMFNKIVPPWVRQYSRMIIELRNSGELDREVLGVALLPNATARSVRAGVRYTVLIALIMSALIVMANLAYNYMDLPCMFPPCY